MEMIALFRKRHPELVVARRADRRRVRRLQGTAAALAAESETKLERVLGYLLDENEFLGPYGIRSLSRYHLDHPFAFWVGRPGIQGAVPAGRIQHRDVRRQLQLARPGLDAGQRADRPRPPEPVRASTATSSRSSARPAPATA